MSNKSFAFVISSIFFSIACLLCAKLHIVAYKQETNKNLYLNEQINNYKEIIKEYKIIYCNNKSEVE